jgi:hypothetical protein
MEERNKNTRVQPGAVKRERPWTVVVMLPPPMAPASSGFGGGRTPGQKGANKEQSGPEPDNGSYKHHMFTEKGKSDNSVRAVLPLKSG